MRNCYTYARSCILIQSHNPSWGCVTIQVIGDSHFRVELITPHGDA